MVKPRKTLLPGFPSYYIQSCWYVQVAKTPSSARQSFSYGRKRPDDGKSHIKKYSSQEVTEMKVRSLRWGFH